MILFAARMQHPIHFFVKVIRPPFRRGNRYVRFMMVYMFGLTRRARRMWLVFVPRRYMFSLAGRSRRM